jgi:hypothetical protein
MTLEKFLDKPSAFIFSQGIAPLVHERLKDRPDIRIDKELSEELEEYFRYRCLFHLQIEAETKGALARLQKAGIETLLLKGFPLSYLLYGTPALRPYSDVDILVRKEKASDVKSVLTPLGYSFPPGVSGEYVSQEFVAEKNANGIPVALDFHLALSSAVFFKDLFTFRNKSTSITKLS